MCICIVCNMQAQNFQQIWPPVVKMSPRNVLQQFLQGVIQTFQAGHLRSPAGAMAGKFTHQVQYEHWFGCHKSHVHQEDQSHFIQCMALGAKLQVFMIPEAAVIYLPHIGWLTYVVSYCVGRQSTERSLTEKSAILLATHLDYCSVCCIWAPFLLMFVSLLWGPQSRMIAPSCCARRCSSFGWCHGYQAVSLVILKHTAY